MKAVISILLISLVALIGCKCDLETIFSNVDGNYVGTFERNGTETDVEIKLRNGKFSGEEEVHRFPAIGDGSFTVSNDTIYFQDQNFWTADFDWTLILHGAFHISKKKNTLSLINAMGDKYTLTEK